MQFPLAGDKSTLSDSGISVSCNSILTPETFKYISKTNLPRGVKWDTSSPPTAQSWLESFSQVPSRDTSTGRSFLWHFALTGHPLCLFCEEYFTWILFAHRLTCGFLLLCLKGKFALNGEHNLHATQVQAGSYTSLETGNAPASLPRPVDSFISTSRL